MRVTRDKYQLPLAVADSAAELAEMCGCSPDAVWYGCFRSNPTKHNTYPGFVAVDVDSYYEKNTGNWLNKMVKAIRENDERERKEAERKMKEKRISDILYNNLFCIYCDNCRFHSEEVPEFCVKCKNKNNYWGISREKANKLAKEIVEGK